MSKSKMAKCRVTGWADGRRIAPACAPLDGLANVTRPSNVERNPRATRTTIEPRLSYRPALLRRPAAPGALPLR
ncbi:hypothetical protein K8353_07455 [Burkholderia contaminans]|nr:hypothetical protein [Burkholderia contaminans]